MKKLLIALIFGAYFIVPISGFANEMPKLESRNIQDIEIYRQNVIALHASVLKKSVFSIITLKSPLEVGEIRDFAEKYRINVRTVLLSMIDFEGELVTSLGSFMITQEMLSDFEANSQEILGVYVLIGGVSVESLEALQADPKVFLVDIKADKSITGRGQSFAEEMINR